MKNPFAFFVSLAAAFAASAAGAVFSMSAIDGWYMTLQKPELNPPNWVFGPVWTILYVMMATAAYLVYVRGKNSPESKKALGIYGVHLVFNALWSIVFFGLQAPFAALGIIGILLAFILVMIPSFWHIDRRAGLLLLPYLVWVAFATYLNLMIVLLN